MFRQTLLLYRNAYTGLSRPIWIQAVIMLINRSGTMVIPFLTVYLTASLHFSIVQAGAVLSIFGIGSVLGVYVGGKLTDTIGFFPVQFWSLFSNGVMFLILGQVSAYWMICACVFLLACIGESFRPANAAATAHYSRPENRTRSYSLNRLAINLGFAVGPALGGFLAGISYGWLFWADGLTCIGAALILRWKLRPSGSAVKAEPGAAETPSTAIEAAAITPFEVESPAAATAAVAFTAGSATTAAATAAPKGKRTPVPSPYRDKTYLRFVFLVWVFSLGFFQIFSVIPLYYQKAMHLSNPQIGMIFSMNGILIALIEMVLVYRLENRRPGTFYISIGVFLNALSFLVLGAGGPFAWIAIASMLLMTVAEMMSVPFMNSYFISRSSPQNRGQYAALYGMAFSAAQVVAPIMGAQIVGLLSFKWLWAILFLMGILNAWGFRLLGARRASGTMAA